MGVLVTTKNLNRMSAILLRNLQRFEKTAKYNGSNVLVSSRTVRTNDCAERLNLTIYEVNLSVNGNKYTAKANTTQLLFDQLGSFL